MDTHILRLYRFVILALKRAISKVILGSGVSLILNLRRECPHLPSLYRRHDVICGGVDRRGCS